MADRDQLLDIYRKMVTIRKFEEAVWNLYTAAIMPGLAHLYIGQEAVAVGVCSVLRKDDYNYQYSPRPRALSGQSNGYR